MTEWDLAVEINWRRDDESEGSYRYSRLNMDSLCNTGVNLPSKLYSIVDTLARCTRTNMWLAARSTKLCQIHRSLEVEDSKCCQRCSEQEY